MLYTRNRAGREERREGWREEGTVLAFPRDYGSFVAAEFDDRKRNGNISTVTDGAVHSFRPGFFSLNFMFVRFSPDMVS